MGQHLDSDAGLALNLSTGSLTRSGAGRVLPIPAHLLAGLVASMSSAQLRSWGQSWGELLSASLVGDGVEPRSSEWVVKTLAREFALWGLGQPALEQWGRALVLVVREPIAQPACEALLAGVVEGALREAFSRPHLEVVPVERAGQDGGAPLRLLVCGPRAAERVRQAQAEGVGWAQVVVELNRAGAGNVSNPSRHEQAN